MAHDNSGEAYLWWRDDTAEEPWIVNISGGSIKFYRNIKDALLYYAEGREELGLDLLEEVTAEREDLPEEKFLTWT